MIKNFKYYAGLIDADGSLNIMPRPLSNGNTRINIQVVIKLRYDQEEILQPIADHYNVKLYHYSVVDNRTGNTYHSVGLNLNGKKAMRLLEMIKKHLVIKQSIAEWLLSVYNEEATPDRLEAIKAERTSLRLDTTPSKKNHPTRQWVAGYIDGDGCINSGYAKDTGSLSLQIMVATSIHDPQGVLLLHKAFGGRFQKRDNTLRWYLNIGDPSKAEQFLTFCNSHLRIKRWQADYVLGIIRERKHLKKHGATPESNLLIHETLMKAKKPHRLSDKNPTG